MLKYTFYYRKVELSKIYTQGMLSFLLMDKKFTNTKNDIEISLKQPSKIKIRLNL